MTNMLQKIIKKMFDVAHYFRKKYWKIFKIKTFGARVLLLNKNPKPSVGQGKVYLVMHRYGNLWVFPGGGLKKGEDIEEVAKREVFEETGITVKSFSKKLGTYRNSKEGKDDTISIFVCDDWEVSNKLSFYENIMKIFEIKRGGWFDINNLPENTSPATKRRVVEYLGGEEEIGGDW